MYPKSDLLAVYSGFGDAFALAHGCTMILLLDTTD